MTSCIVCGAAANYVDWMGMPRCPSHPTGGPVVAELDRLRAANKRLEAALAEMVIAAAPFANDQGCDAVHHSVADRHDQREMCPVVARLIAAIEAAKVTP